MLKKHGVPPLKFKQSLTLTKLHLTPICIIHDTLYGVLMCIKKHTTIENDPKPNF
jgi:hypothetical protein